MAGTLTISTLSDGTNSTSATNCISGSAKAWVNFNGTTATPSTIRASYNVTSVTKLGTGQYQVNFTNALVDGNYAVAGMARYTNGGSTDGRCVIGNSSTGMATTYVQVSFINAADTAVIDPVVYCVAVFR
jgi:beta-galactosidase GanA